jgi:N-acetylglucosamine-6-phosphate deacetylase
MVGSHHREPGTLGAAMALSEIFCELIADNIHVHPTAMRILYQIKGRDKVILVSDAIRSAGMPDGEYPIDERTVIVKDGIVRLKDGTLAGSTLTMNQALHNFMRATGEPIEYIWQCSSFNAAKAISIADRKGSLEVGKDADFVIVDENINILLTAVSGNIVYQKTGDNFVRITR